MHIYIYIYLYIYLYIYIYVYIYIGSISLHFAHAYSSLKTLINSQKWAKLKVRVYDWGIWAHDVSGHSVKSSFDYD